MGAVFTDPGATATDAVDGGFLDTPEATDAVLTGKVGSYPLT